MVANPFRLIDSQLTPFMLLHAICFRLRLIVAALLGVMGITRAAAVDWPEFRGPARDGKSTEKIVAAFPSEGPAIVWKQSVGSGFAGPAVAKGRLILFHREGGQAIIEAFGAADGRKLWRQATATDYTPWNHTIDIADTEKQQLAIPVLVEDPTRRLLLEARLA